MPIIQYRIDTLTGPEMTYGYAIQLPPPFAGLRFCARPEHGVWHIDHYDSGRSVTGPQLSVLETDAQAIKEARQLKFDCRSQASAIKSLLAYLHHLRDTGKLRPAFTRAGYGWCLDEAGL